mmetsp:Transcript_2521/g.7466  ORF Transcript_2521/g.7466 Transcript_2521/m.7466 type:complete len:209 (-) Transcript_2521:596-1222(-)
MGSAGRSYITSPTPSRSASRRFKRSLEMPRNEVRHRFTTEHKDKPNTKADSRTESPQKVQVHLLVGCVSAHTSRKKAPLHLSVQAPELKNPSLQVRDNKTKRTELCCYSLLTSSVSSVTSVTFTDDATSDRRLAMKSLTRPELTSSICEVTPATFLAATGATKIAFRLKDFMFSPVTDMVTLAPTESVPEIVCWRPCCDSSSILSMVA